MDNDPHLTDANGSAAETHQQIKARIKTHADNYWTLRNKLILIATLGSAMGLAISLVSLVFAWKAASQSWKTQRELWEGDFTRQQKLREQDFERQRKLKEIDMRQYCQKRYDDLAYDAKARVKTDDDARGYYKRFWDLQFEQYQYCKEGVIDQKIYKTWMDSRRREHKDDERVGKMGSQEGWDYMSGIFIKNEEPEKGAYTEFVAFMNEVFAGTKKTCELNPGITLK